MLLNMQKNVLPNVWRFVPFDTIIDMASKLEAQPLTDSPNASANFKMYKNSAKGSGQGDSEETERKFLDWRKAFVILALMAGKIPTSEEKESYFSKLRAKLSVSEDNLLKKNAFVSVSIPNHNYLFLAHLLFDIYRLKHGSTNVKVQLYSTIPCSLFHLASRVLRVSQLAAPCTITKLPRDSSHKSMLALTKMTMTPVIWNVSIQSSLYCSTRIASRIARVFCLKTSLRILSSFSRKAEVLTATNAPCTTPSLTWLSDIQKNRFYILKFLNHIIIYS